MNLDSLGPPYVLNLPQSKGRLKTIAKHLLEVHNSDFYLFPATLGREVDVDAVKEEGYLPLKFQKPDHPKFQGILGCMESHRQIWNDVAANEKGPILVLEDDARLVPDFKTKLQTILASVPEDGWDYINLCALRPTGKVIAEGKLKGLKQHEDWELKKVVPTNERRGKFMRQVPNAWTSTYLIRAESIPKLLAAWKDESSKGRFNSIKRRLYHVDWLWSFLSHVPEYKIDFYSLRRRAIAYRDDLHTSDLDHANKQHAHQNRPHSNAIRR